MINKYGYNSNEQFRNNYQGWVEATRPKGKQVREPAWSESIAVGGKVFIDNIKEKLGAKATGRKIAKKKDNFILNEPNSSYKADFVHYWDV